MHLGEVGRLEARPGLVFGLCYGQINLRLAPDKMISKEAEAGEKTISQISPSSPVPNQPLKQCSDLLQFWDQA